MYLFFEDFVQELGGLLLVVLGHLAHGNATKEHHGLDRYAVLHMHHGRLLAVHILGSYGKIVQIVHVALELTRDEIEAFGTREQVMLQNR